MLVDNMIVSGSPSAWSRGEDALDTFTLVGDCPDTTILTESPMVRLGTNQR